jgi:predicted dithiol-disulfide oxidoreductase (DUF899 family)
MNASTSDARPAAYNSVQMDEPEERGRALEPTPAFARGTDVFNTFYQLLDRAPKGRDEDNIRAGSGGGAATTNTDERLEREWPSG